MPYSSPPPTPRPGPRLAWPWIRIAYGSTVSDPITPQRLAMFPSGAFKRPYAYPSSKSRLDRLQVSGAPGDMHCGTYPYASAWATTTSADVPTGPDRLKPRRPPHARTCAGRSSTAPKSATLTAPCSFPAMLANSVVRAGAQVFLDEPHGLAQVRQEFAADRLGASPACGRGRTSPRPRHPVRRALIERNPSSSS